MITILIVDDDADLNSVLSSFFLGKGMRVLTADNLEEGLEKAGRRRIDIALIDYQLGDGLGLALVDRLKMVHPSTHIVVITGFNEENLQEEVLARGAKAFFEKPLDLFQLEHWVDHVMGRDVETE